MDSHLIEGADRDICAHFELKHWQKSNAREIKDGVRSRLEEPINIILACKGRLKR